MKLQTATISNYRSILSANKLAIGEYTVLVGPNNEGKSNVLKALNLALLVLTHWEPTRRSAYRWTFASFERATRDESYDWSRDFPISLQQSKPDGRSVISLEFKLTSQELQDFQRLTNINLSTNLKIKLAFGKDNVSYDVLMKGPGKKSLNSKRETISEFIKTRLVYQYVSAIRPASSAKEIVNRVLETELRQVQQEKEYTEALKRLQVIEEPILDRLSQRISTTLAKFLPAVRSVIIREAMVRRRTRRQFDVDVDDGTLTELSMKGDGIISLTTMALVRDFASELSGNQSLVFAIEEPESHLHPYAVTELRSVLHSLASESQVILSTHSPILVNRTQIAANVLVEGAKARRPKDIADIRRALGIHLSDNLMNAQLVLLVEGGTDKTMLETLLPAASSKIKHGIEQGLFAIDCLQGASKLSYYAKFYIASMSEVHVFFDNDQPGQAEVRQALEKGIIGDHNYTMIRCSQMAESEFEDMFNPKSYLPEIAENFNLSLNSESLPGHGKWSNRVRKIFEESGKLWNSKVEMRVKTLFADTIEQKGLPALDDDRRQSFDALVSQLESQLGQH